MDTRQEEPKAAGRNQPQPCSDFWQSRGRWRPSLCRQQQMTKREHAMQSPWPVIPLSSPS